jgi:hypothetical protein
MRLWRRQPHGDRPAPEPVSDKHRLEQLLYRIADGINDGFWSEKVRASADQIRAGNADGLRNFLGLFGGMGSINDSDFGNRGQLSEAYDLAKALLREHDYEMSRHSGERGER